MGKLSSMSESVCTYVLSLHEVILYTMYLLSLYVDYNFRVLYIFISTPRITHTHTHIHLSVISHEDQARDLPPAEKLSVEENVPIRRNLAHSNEEYRLFSRQPIANCSLVSFHIVRVDRRDFVRTSERFRKSRGSACENPFARFRIFAARTA